METLTWLFFAMSSIISAYVTFRITKWYYLRKIKKINDSIIATQKQKTA